MITLCVFSRIELGFIVKSKFNKQAAKRKMMRVTDSFRDMRIENDSTNS